MLAKLEAMETMPHIADTLLPDYYQIPYETACRKLRSRFGELTVMEMRMVFSMVKRYFILLLRLFKTYAAFEGKNGQGLNGMSTMIWGVCCKAMKLPLEDADSNLEFIYEIFEASCAETIAASRHSVEMASKSQFRKLLEEKNDDLESEGITGVWQTGSTSSRAQLWTLEATIDGGFTGFIGDGRKDAQIDGDIKEEGLRFTITWLSNSEFSGQTARCKGVLLEEGDIRVRYMMNTGKKGYWVLQRTGAKVRVKMNAVSSLRFDSFIEAIIRLAIFVWYEVPAWEAVEQLVADHIALHALKAWDCTPEVDFDLQRLYKEREAKAVLTSVFSTYSKARTKRIPYLKWEKLLMKVNNMVRGSSLQTASLRTIQFAFFTAKELFPQDGPLDELNLTEFKFALARLAYKMVRSKGSRTDKSGDLASQVKALLRLLKQVKR